MEDNTINNDRTMGGANGTLVAGRYRIVRQLGHGGMGSTICVFDRSRMEADICGVFDCNLWYNV